MHMQQECHGDLISCLLHSTCAALQLASNPESALQPVEQSSRSNKVRIKAGVMSTFMQSSDANTIMVMANLTWLSFQLDFSSLVTPKMIVTLKRGDRKQILYQAFVAFSQQMRD